MAAADVAKSASIGVMICVILIASNGRGSRDTTMVLPGIKIFLEENRDRFTKLDLPFGNIMKILSWSADSFKPPESWIVKGFRY